LPKAEAPAKPAESKGKLTYKLQRELEQLPADIDKAEKEIAALEKETAVPGFYQRPRADTAAVLAKISEAQLKLEQLFARWEELEALK
jgi:ATP-binding cassette subfamily F protein uup